MAKTANYIEELRKENDKLNDVLKEKGEIRFDKLVKSKYRNETIFFTAKSWSDKDCRTVIWKLKILGCLLCFRKTTFPILKMRMSNHIRTMHANIFSVK